MSRLWQSYRYLVKFQRVLKATWDTELGPAQSHADAPLVNDSGKPATVEEPVKTYPTVTCSLCDGEVPKSIAKRCLDCDLHFHPGHYQRHRDEWPCPQIDFDFCPWCNEHIEEEHNIADCSVCHYTMHAECVVKHSPCPDGWNNKEKSDAAEPSLSQPVHPAPSTPRAATDNPTTTRARQLIDELEGLLKSGE